MRLKDTGLTVADVKAMAQKYQIETYERMDFLADWAEGVYMYDENDQPYLDFYAGIAVNSLGNCNPKVVAAVQEQCATLMQTFNYPYTVPQVLLSKEIDHGIYVKSGTGNASLNIKNVAVTSSTNGDYAAGVYVMSGAGVTNSPNISLSVDGGSLTASGTGSSDGILFYVGSINQLP